MVERTGTFGAGAAWALLSANIGCSDESPHHPPSQPDASLAPTDGATPRTESGVDQPGFVPPRVDGSPSRPCNGFEALCDRPYDGVVYLATHDSMAVGSLWAHPAQARSIGEQLANGGVRVMMLEVQADHGVPTLCAGACNDGSESVVQAFGDIRDFFEDNQREVVTLVVKTALPATTLVPVFEASRLSTWAHSQVAGNPWPTLGEMIAGGHRLVVFIDDADGSVLGTREAGAAADAAGSPARPDAAAGSAETGASVEGGTTPAWMHRFADWFWQTSTNVETGSAFDCAPAQGNPQNRLILVNHYISAVGASEDALFGIDSPAAVAAHIRRCESDQGRLPNILAVDFAEVGDPNGGVQIANGLRVR